MAMTALSSLEIPQDQSLSNAIDCRAVRIVRIGMPDDWTGAPGPDPEVLQRSGPTGFQRAAQVRGFWNVDRVTRFGPTAPLARYRSSTNEVLAPRSGPRHRGVSMRVTLALAALPLVVFALAPRVPVRASAPLAPTPVVSEGVRVIPLDARSFNARWWPDQAPTAVRVKTVPVRVLTNEKPGELVAEPAETTAALPPPVHAMKRAALQVTRTSAPGMACGKWMWCAASGRAGAAAEVNNSTQRRMAMPEVQSALCPPKCESTERGFASCH